MYIYICINVYIYTHDSASEREGNNLKRLRAFALKPGAGSGLDCLICVKINVLFCFFSTLVTGHRRFLRVQLSDTRVYAPQIRARLGTTAHFQSKQSISASLARGDPRDLQVVGLGCLV